MKAFLIAAAAAIAVSGSAALFFALRTPPFDYGRFGPQVAASRAILDREPCDRGAIVPLVNAQLGAGDTRGAITASRAFLEKCGEFPRLREVLYTAHRRLSERDEALAEANRLLEQAPYNHTYLWWRGQVHAEQGDWTRALDDHRRSTALCPDCLGQFDLADALEKVGRPCEAIEPLATVLALRRNLRRDAVEGRLAELRARPGCREWSGSGKARFVRGRGAVFAPLQINGVALGQAVVDTGATFVALSARDARRAGLTGPTLSAPFATAGGVRTGAITTADLVEAGGLQARHVTVVILDAVVEPLLGMSFLTRFEMRMDRRGIELSAR